MGKSNGPLKDIQYKKPHFPKLSESALYNRLLRIKSELNSYHYQANKGWSTALRFAQKAGNLLIEVKERLPHGQWTDWLDENFEGSLSTARAYMRIARNWWKGSMVSARQEMQPLSIRNVLEIIEGNKSKSEEKPAPIEYKPDYREAQRQHIRDRFATEIRSLKPEELDLLCNWTSFDALWKQYHQELKSTVCAVLEFDVYEDPAEQQDREEVMRKISKALNRSRLAIA